MQYALLIAALIGIILIAFFSSNARANRLGEILIFWSIGAFLFAVAPLAVRWLQH